MSNSTLQVRISNELKQSAEVVFSDMGMDIQKVFKCYCIKLYQNIKVFPLQMGIILQKD